MSGKKNVFDVPTINEQCLICLSPNRAAIRSMSELGATLEEIAVACQLNATDIQKHLDECVGVDDIAGLAGSDDRLLRLLNDATELFHASTLAGNLTAASSALGVRVRALSEAFRRSESRAKHKSFIENADPRDPNTWSEPLRKFLQGYIDQVLENCAAIDDKKKAIQ